MKKILKMKILNLINKKRTINKYINKILKKKMKMLNNKLKDIKINFYQWMILIIKIINKIIRNFFIIIITNNKYLMLTKTN
jgi:hypothetical protein